MIEGALRIEGVFMGDSILRKTDRTLSKGEDVVVCLPGVRIEHVTERVENVLGHGQGGSILVHVGTSNAERERILPVMRGRGATYINCNNMAINTTNMLCFWKMSQSV